jgi:hypothetical protein
MWNLSLGFGSIYQLLNFITTTIVPGLQASKITEMLRRVHGILNRPGLAPSILALLEISALLPRGGMGAFRTLIRFQAYLFWYVVYRYVTDNFHRQIWSEYYNKISNFVRKLPAFIANLLLKLLDAFAMCGTIGYSIYKVSAG